MAPSNSALGSDDVAKPKKVRNERRPCHCYKCKGQLRDRHTVKKHAEESERINAPGLEKVLLGESSSKKRKRNKVKEDEKGPEDDSMDVDVRGSRSGAEDGNELNELEVVAGPPAGGLDIGGEMKSGQPDEGTQDGGLGGEPLEKVDNGIQEQIGMDIEMDPRPASSIFGEAGQPDGKNGGRRSPSPLNWSPSGDFMDGEYEDAPPDSRSPSPGPDDDLDSGGPGDVDPTAEDDNLPTPEPSVIETIRFSDELIELIRNASLDNDKLTDDMRTALRNPVQGPYPELTDDYLRCEPTDSKQDWFWVCLTGENWTSHGLDVENAGQYLPSLFHRIPRNPALKISSSYKCTEYNVYFYKLGRVFFRKYLPKVVWQHYCLLVHAVDILSQRSITREQLIEAHEALVAFVRGYEDLYYQGREDRLHFCRGAIHTLLHTSPEAFRVGPGAYVTQYTLEGLIGDLGAEIRQPSNPFGNLKKIALRRCQMNAAKVIYPHLDPDSKIQPPRGSRPLDGGYVLLTPKAPSLKATSRLGAMGTLIQKELGMLHILQWGRLMLPNGQYSRSHFVESRCTRLTRRVSRMVKIERAAPSVNGLPGPKITEFAEVQFFFLTSQEEPKAMVSVFGPRVERLYTESHSTIWACKFPKPQDTQHLRICDVSEIVTVVSMQPFVKCDEDTDLDDDLWFVAEKSGLDDPSLYLTLEALNRHLSQDAV